MVYLANFDKVPAKFVYAIFGVQYDTLTSAKRTTIATLYGLLAKSADKVDCLRDEDHGISNNKPKTTTFVAYWLHNREYESWKDSPDVQGFWSRLPDDAGVWREVMTVPKSRYMFAASQNITWGLTDKLDLVQSNDEGYWGVYRHRLAANPDAYTDPEDQFVSPFVTAVKAKPGTEKIAIDIPQHFVSSIKPGRVHVQRVPDNLCFVREGQRQQHVSHDERQAWLEQISPHAQSWISHLDQERNKNGVVGFTTHVGLEQPPVSADGAAVSAEMKAETDQLCYFLDLAHFELAGRQHKGHVELRKNVMTLYGPGGALSGGKAELFVELCILKSGDLDAEYIGCAEGTGLSFLQGL